MYYGKGNIVIDKSWKLKKQLIQHIFEKIFQKRYTPASLIAKIN